MLISLQDKQNLINLLKEIILPIEVLAYESKASSNVLVLFIRDKNIRPLPSELLTKLGDKIKESNFPILVSIKDWSTLPQNMQQYVLSEYEMFYDSSDKVIESESFQEPFENSFDDTKNIIHFFNSFEESENYSRLKMAKMSPEERLTQLKKLRTMSVRLAPTKHSSGSNLLTIKIEMGVSK
jgi:hypothetical protein